MYWLIKFVKNDTVNGIEYKKGDVLRVSESIRNAMVNSGSAKDAVEEKGSK